MILFAQLTATAALTASMLSTASAHDREVFGVRYRTPVVAGLSLHAGVLSTNENGLLHPGDAAGIRHWAVAGEYAVTSWWRTQLIYGNFDEARPHDSPLPFTYYRFGALGEVFQLGRTSLTVEKVFSAMHETHAAIHDVEMQAHSEFWDAMASSVRSSRDQSPYHFVTVEATIRPCARCVAPFRYMGMEGGTRALPSPTTDRETLVTFISAGLFLSLEPRH